MQLGRLEIKGKMGRDLSPSSAGCVLGHNTLRQGGWMALCGSRPPTAKTEVGQRFGAKGNTEGDPGHCPTEH